MSFLAVSSSMLNPSHPYPVSLTHSRVYGVILNPSYPHPCAAPPQMAPYNTQYERLAAHMEAAGVTAEPNLWDRPVSLAREHRSDLNLIIAIIAAIRLYC